MDVVEFLEAHALEMGCKFFTQPNYFATEHGHYRENRCGTNHEVGWRSTQSFKHVDKTMHPY